MCTAVQRRQQRGFAYRVGKHACLPLALFSPTLRVVFNTCSQESARGEDRKRERDDRGGDGADAQRVKQARTDAIDRVPTAEAAAAELSPEEEEALAAARREEEQAKLDAEMERRRQRVEQWQAQRRKQQAAEQLAAGGAAPPADAQLPAEANGAPRAFGGESEEAQVLGAEGEAKTWTLDGDDDDDDGAPQPVLPDDDDELAVPMVVAGGREESAVAQQKPQAIPSMTAAQPPAPVAAATVAASVHDDVDPLDAFMAAQVLPEVQRLAQQEHHLPMAVDGDVAAAIDTNGTVAMDAAPSPTHAETLPSAAPASAVGGAPPAVIVRPGGFRGLVVRPIGAGAIGGRPGGGPTPRTGRRAAESDDSSGSDGGSEDEGEEGDSDDDEAWAKRAMAGQAGAAGAKKSKAERLGPIDHSQIQYAAFRKNFYIESAEIARMSAAEVTDYRRTALDGVKCRGKDVPKPIKAWTQAGLPGRVLEALKKHGCGSPMAIQAQALPVIMSGRDCIGVAKTGSGKTLAFLLPLLRHAKDQEPLASGDGPIGLIMAPTRELVTQIGREAKRYASCVGLATVCVYGGTGVGQQISDLKRGAEIVVCTPGRMIDILASSNGRVTNLRRVTYLVLDEADRMFDLGFEPQISRILAHTRPDRQTVMFSATFPHAMEMLARSALKNPVEVTVGGRSIVNPDIEQYIEIRPDGQDRFLRLLELLGQWYETGKIIVFVSSQERCDSVFRDLLRAGYPCLSLHGGKDQSDRECTIADFKTDVCNVLVATSVAARGLDVKELRLVVNYDVPNHYEEYVHRCGRTGRAGNKGTAVTFLAADEERFAPDLVKALKDSGKEVPQDLLALADSFNRKRRDGLVQAHGSGFGGSGFAFSLLEDGQRIQERKQLALEYGGDAAALGGDSESDHDLEPGDEDDGAGIVLNRGLGQPAVMAPPTLPGGVPTSAAPPGAMAPPSAAPAAVAASAIAAAMSASMAQPGTLPGGGPAPGSLMPASRVQAAVSAASMALVSASAAAVSNRMLMPIGAAVPSAGPACPPPPGSAAAIAAQAAAAAVSAAPGAAQTPAQRAAAFAAQLSATRGMPGAVGGAAAAPPGADEDRYSAEIEINDFPQHARWKVTHKESLRSIQDDTGAVITTRGMFIPPGKPLAPGDRKLFLLIEAGTERSVREAKMRIRQLLEEAAAKELLPGGFGGPAGGAQQPGGRYSTF